MKPKDEIHGALVVDKPEGPTSHDVVVKVRRILRTRVGHAGTLDPAASGVLPLLLGKSTRLLRFLSHNRKVYLAEITLGTCTDTQDRQGRVISNRPVPQFSQNRILAVLASFQGSIEQIPPMYSAVKVEGERLYKAARRNETRERPPRKITIFELTLENVSLPRLNLKVTCSSGTYIRTLADDIGKALGCGAFLSRLRRTRSGPFSLERSLSWDRIEEEWGDYLTPMEEVLSEMPSIDLSNNDLLKVQHGNPIQVENAGTGEQGFCRLIHGGLLVAVGALRKTEIQPVVVLRPKD